MKRLSGLLLQNHDDESSVNHKAGGGSPMRGYYSHLCVLRLIFKIGLSLGGRFGQI